MSLVQKFPRLLYNRVYRLMVRRKMIAIWMDRIVYFCCISLSSWSITPKIYMLVYLVTKVTATTYRLKII